MTLVDLTFFILGLNHLVDQGNSLTFDEVHDHIERGDVIEWLDKRFAGNIDLSIYRGRPEAQEIAKGLQAIHGAYAGAENRKWGVQRNGLCLLIAWVNELVQQRAWKDERASAA